MLMMLCIMKKNHAASNTTIYTQSMATYTNKREETQLYTSLAGSGNLVD